MRGKKGTPAMPTAEHTRILMEIHRAVGEMSGRQLQFLDQFRLHVDDDKKAWQQVEDLVARQNRVKGAVKLMAAVFGTVSGLVGAFLAKHLGALGG